MERCRLTRKSSLQRFIVPFFGLRRYSLTQNYCFRYEQSSVVSNAFQPIYLRRCTAASKTLRTMSMYARHVFKFSSYFTFAVTEWYILARPEIKFPLPNTVVYTTQYLTTICAQPQIQTHVYISKVIFPPILS